MHRPILTICLATGSLLLSGCEPLTANELEHEAGAIHSTAAEGALLAGILIALAGAALLVWLLYQATT